MIIGKIALFQKMPYLLPTLLGGTVMFIGAFLACFLSWDGGVRGGSRIQLEVEKDEPLNSTRPDTLSPSAAASRPSAAPGSSAIRIQHRSSMHTPAEDPQTPYGRSALGRSALATSAGMHRDSMASLGTAYGYGGIRSKHPTLAARRAIEAARRASGGSALGDDGEGGHGNRNVSFATKLMLANEDNNFNINDLWLSAAVAQDTAVFDDDDEYDEEYEDGSDDERDDRSPNLIDIDDAGSSIAADDDVTPSPSAPSSPTRASVSHGSTRRSSRLRMTSGGSDFSRYLRRPSSASRRHSVSSQHIPSIFSNTGVASTPGISAFEEPPEETNEDLFSPTGTVRRVGAPSGLAAISEGRPDSVTAPAPSIDEKEPSRWAQLPLLVIAQYGLLSCHDSTHGQIFLSFIVT